MITYTATEPGTGPRAYSFEQSGTAPVPGTAAPFGRWAAAPFGRSDAGMSRTWWPWIRLLGGAAILAVLVWRLGTGPFLDGVREIDVSTLLAAAGIAAVTTVCCAWRWTMVARGLGVAVPLPTAIAAYYRSQFLNTTLPGGVLGDVHRGVRHGREVGDVGRGLRAVAWERTAGQIVQLVLAVLVLLVLPSPVRSSIPVIAAVTVLAALAVVLIAGAVPHGGASRWARALRAAGRRRPRQVCWLADRGLPSCVASTVVVAGHTATFLIAARTAGATASLWRLLPLALLVLLAMGLPDEHRWLGAAGGRRGVGVRCGRARRLGRRRHGRHLRRHGAGREPARRRRAPGHLAPAAPSAGHRAHSGSGSERAAIDGHRDSPSRRFPAAGTGRPAAWVTARTRC